MRWTNGCGGRLCCDPIASIVLMLLFGLPGVFAGTILRTTVMYVRPYLIWREAFGGKGGPYYWLAAKTILQAPVIYGVLHYAVHP